MSAALPLRLTEGALQSEPPLIESRCEAIFVLGEAFSRTPSFNVHALRHHHDVKTRDITLNHCLSFYLSTRSCSNDSRRPDGDEDMKRSELGEARSLLASLHD